MTPKTRREVLELLVTGLKRLEYRGYDSAGVAIDTDDGKGIVLIKQTGKVKILEDAIAEQLLGHDLDSPVISHCGISHTRWATHGPPSELNSHPHRSDLENTFVVVHNGIITNYKDIKKFLEKRGYFFESETDTEIIAKLVHHLYMQHPSYSFRELVEQVIVQLVSYVRLILSCVLTRNYISGRSFRFSLQVKVLPRRVRCNPSRLSLALRNQDEDTSRYRSYSNLVWKRQVWRREKCFQSNSRSLIELEDICALFVFTFYVIFASDAECCYGLNETCDCCWGKCVATKFEMCKAQLEMFDHDMMCEERMLKILVECVLQLLKPNN